MSSRIMAFIGEPDAISIKAEESSQTVTVSDSSDDESEEAFLCAMVKEVEVDDDSDNEVFRSTFISATRVRSQDKNLITLAGNLPEETVLTWNNTATKIEHHQAARVIGTWMFGCGTTIVEGEDFIAENITFENSAPKGSGQAVAIRVTADRCAFYNCRFLGRLFQFPKHGKNIPKTLCSQIKSFVIPQSSSLSGSHLE